MFQLNHIEPFNLSEPDSCSCVQGLACCNCIYLKPSLNRSALQSEISSCSALSMRLPEKLSKAWALDEDTFVAVMQGSFKGLVNDHQ